MSKNKIIIFNNTISWLFVFFVFLLLGFYFYYRNLIFVGLIFIFIVFFLLLILLFLLFVYTKATKRNVFFTKQLVVKINIWQIFLLFLFVSFLIANISLLFYHFFNFDKAFFIEYHIVVYLLSVSIFYFLYFLLNISWGERLLLFFGVDGLPRKEKIIFSYALSFSFFAIIFFLIAFCGILYKAVVLPLLFLITVFSVQQIKDNLLFIGKKHFYVNIFSKRDIIFIFVFILLAAYFVFIFKPLPATTDDLHTYWNAPLEYARVHSYLPMTNVRTASATQNNEMIYAAIILLFGTKYIIHFQFFSFVFFLFVIYYLAEIYFNKRNAVIALFATLLVPWNFYYLNTVKLEATVLLFSAILCLALYKYIAEKKIFFLTIFSWLAGFLFGIKYATAFLFLPLFLFLFLFLFNTDRTAGAVKKIILSSFLAFLAFSPWLLKNYYFFHTPFYPYSFWGTADKASYQLTRPNDYGRKRMNEINQLRHYGGEQIGFLKTMFYQAVGKDIDKRVWINFGIASPLFLFFFFFLAGKKKKLQVLNLLMFFYFLLWFLEGGNRPWYGIFGYTVISFLILYYLFQYKYWSWLYIVFLLMINLIYIIPWEKNLLYLSGQISEDKYKHIFLPYAPTADFLNNSHLLSGAKILLVGDTATATINNNGQKISSDQYLTKISYSLNKGEEFLKKDLHNHGFSYLIYSQLLDMDTMKWTMANKGLTIDQYLLSYQGEIPSIYQDIAKLKVFLRNNAELIFDDGFYSLYKI